MSLLTKWLPLERGVDFWLEMLKTLAPEHIPELGGGPGRLQKTTKIHIVLERFYLVLCIAKIELKESQIQQKPGRSNVHPLSTRARRYNPLPVTMSVSQSH